MQQTQRPADPLRSCTLSHSPAMASPCLSRGPWCGFAAPALRTSGRSFKRMGGRGSGPADANRGPTSLGDRDRSHNADARCGPILAGFFLRKLIARRLVTKVRRMKARLSARCSGEKVALELLDASGEVIPLLELDRYEAFEALSSLAQAMSALPSDRTAPIHIQRPVLKSREPSFQVGVMPRGGVVLAIRPDPLPPLEFEFNAESLTKLIADLRKAAAIPRSSESH
jgi:hypothetical protein